MSNKENIVALKDAQKKSDTIIEIEGVRVRVKPVSAMLMQEVTARIKDPEVPKVPNPDKDNRLDENPFDPAYVAAMREAQVRRNLATSDTLVMFGIELVDGLPIDENWLVKLRKLNKMGLIDISGIDFDDPFEKDFAFKKFVAGTAGVLLEVSKASGISQVDIDTAVESFSGNATQ